MKHFYHGLLILFIAAFVALALPGHALASPIADDKVVFGDTYRLAAGETLDGNLSVFGGAVTLEQGSTVTGNINVLGGAVTGDGLIEGNINILGGTVSLGDQAVVQGNVQTFGGVFRKSDLAVVEGKVTTIGNSYLPVTPSTLPVFNPVWPVLGSVRTVFGGMAAALCLAALAMIVALFWPTGTRRVAHAMIASPALSGGLGCLTLIVFPALIVLLTITIILIPVSLVGILLLGIAFTFSWIAFGTEIGERISQAFNVTWHPAASAGLGTLILTLVVSWASLIPFIGWIFSFLAPLVIVVAGLGSVLLTRFGTQTYPFPLAGGGINPPAPAQPLSPVPSASPVPPVEPPAASPEAPTPPPAQAVAPDLNPGVTAMDASIPDLHPGDETPPSTGQ